jgi:protein SCO1/2
MSFKRSKYFLIITIVILAITMGYWIAKRSAMNSSSLPILSDFGADFKLIVAGGKRVGLNDYKDKVVMLFFGYTFCPDVCPTGMYVLKQVMHTLGTDSTQLQVIMISVDPERDSVDRLQKYVQYFHPSFIGLTGTLKEINQVTKAYLTSFKKEPPSENGDYQVSHGAFFYLLDKQGRVRKLHGPISTPAQIVTDVKSLLAEG